MDQDNKKKVSDKISYFCYKILYDEMKIPNFKSKQEIEDYFTEITEIVCYPLLELLELSILMLKKKNIPKNFHAKIALLIYKKVKNIFLDCLNKNGIESLEAKMERLGGNTFSEVIESVLAMEAMGMEYRMKIPFSVPITDFRDRMKICFPSKEKPIHILLYRENGEGYDEYYIEEVKNPKFRWIKRNSKEKNVLYEFSINDTTK